MKRSEAKLGAFCKSNKPLNVGFIIFFSFRNKNEAKLLKSKLS